MSKRPQIARAGIVPAFLFLGTTLVAGSAAADVSIETSPLRNYELPGTIEVANGLVFAGAGDSTVLVNTMGVSPEEASVGIVIADANGARLIDYQYAGAPTQHIGAIPHPDGGIFLRGSNPLAMMGDVTGFTAYIGPDDTEQWSIADQMLVDAAPEPNGTGEFQGQYETPHGAMSYSPELDKLLGFTIAKLTIGLDEKFLSQAHVINVDSGRLTVSGKTFGLSGVGVVGGTATRSSDGKFLIYYYSSGAQGAFFYAYNGREEIDFFKPRGEDWDDRFVTRMIYQNDLLHLLWSPSNDAGAETRVTATTDSGAELWSGIFESEYRFADGRQAELGLPLTMWVTRDHVAVLHRDATMALFIRVVDRNGTQLGVAQLAEVSEFPPVAIVNGPNDTLTLMSYDMNSRTVFEDTLTFTDVDDFDPDAGIPDGGLPADVGIPADIGVRDVLEAAGCCATAAVETRPTTPILLAFLALITLRRRRRS